MSDLAINIDRFLDLADLTCEEHASGDEFAELDAFLLGDPVSRRRYFNYCRIHVALRLQLRARRATEKMHQQIDVDLGVLASGDSRNTSGVVAPSTTPFGFLSTAYHGTIGFFSQELPFSLLIATLLTGFGLWIASLVYISSPDKIAKDSSPVQSSFDSTLKVVGKITGMVDCKWADPNTETFNGANVLFGRKYALASGLMEITYDTGAKVILQGPVTYEAESNGGYLSLGKLTGKMKKKAKGSDTKFPNLSSLSTIHYPLFTIKTPTATVTDLGTEFGVVVGGKVEVEVHVFQGEVVAQFDAQHGGMNKSVRVSAGQAVRTKQHGTEFSMTHFASEMFVQQLPEQSPNVAAGGMYSRAVLADNPVAYYRLNETVVDAAYDAANVSGGRQQGQQDAIHVNFGRGGGPGNVGQPGPRPSDLVEGKPLLGFEADNRAAYFKPSALTRVQRTDRGTADALDITGALSLEAWICVDNYSSLNQGIVSKWWGRERVMGDVNQRSYYLYIDRDTPPGTHSVALQISSDGTFAGTTTICGSRTVPIGQWVHVAATFVPGRSIRVYCNGAMQAAQTESVPAGIFDSTAPLWIGATYDRTCNAMYFPGRIAEVAIYNYALDDVGGDGIIDATNRVTAHYNAAFQANEEVTPAIVTSKDAKPMKDPT